MASAGVSATFTISTDHSHIKQKPSNHLHCSSCSNPEKMPKPGSLSFRQKNWYCLIFLFGTYFPLTKDSSHGASTFQHRCFSSNLPHGRGICSWVEQRTQYVARRKDTEPCSQSTTSLPAKCETASRPQQWGWVWCDCSKMQGDSTEARTTLCSLENSCQGVAENSDKPSQKSEEDSIASQVRGESRIGVGHPD